MNAIFETAPAAQDATTILVVDDDPVTRHTVCKVLKAAGYRTLEAENGSLALERFELEWVDMVLLDVLMPDMDGFSVCAALRKRADRERIPILMLTGLNDVGSVDRAFTAGASDFITKPINWSLLSQRVRYALRARATYLELRENQARLTRAQQIAKLGCWEADIGSSHAYVSEELRDILGLAPKHSAHDLDDLLRAVHTEDRARVEEAVSNAITRGTPFNIDHRVVRGDGTELIVQQQAAAMDNELGGGVRIMGTIQDISAHKKAEALVEYQANYDVLTGLPNRHRFGARLKRAVASAQAGGDGPAVLFLGLDRLNLIHDSLGHGAGDLLLQSVAERLRRLERRGHTVARFGSDVFALLLENAARADAPTEIAREVLDMMVQSHAIEGRDDLFVGASIGIACHDGAAPGADMLLKGADAAMHRARQEGGNRFCHHDPRMEAEARERLKLESQLRKAMERDELEVYYQPQVDARSGHVVGMEALLRWHHSQMGLVSPLKFIPLAEETGLIVPIGAWVLRTACRQAKEWHERDYGPLRLGVNLSAVQFARGDLVAEVAGILRETGFDPRYLELEVTEGMAMGDVERSIATLRALREIGVQVSLDDFGTGYSSLSYLQRLPIRTLKVDRSFVKDIDADGNNGALASAIIAMAHSLNLNVITEGVETEAQAEFVRQRGCHEIQGFLYSKPLPAEAFESHLLSALRRPRKRVAA